MTIDLQTVLLAIFGTIGTVTLGVAGYLARSSWDDMKKKIDELKAFTGQSVDDLYKTKADNSELIRVRDAQATIFEDIAKHKSDDSMTHSRIMETLGEIKGKMDTLLMRKRGGDG